MTIRAFLKFGNHIVLAGRDKSNDAPYYKAFGEHVKDSETAPSIEVPDSIHLGPVPSGLENAVAYWSMIHHFQLSLMNDNKRDLGKYVLGRATATVESYDGKRQTIAVTGTDVKECIKLRDLILAGSIAPFASHQGPQIKNQVVSLKQAFHQLIEAAFLAWDHARLKVLS